MTKRERSIPMVFRHTDFGNDIFTRRLELKLTASEVAQLITVDQSTVSKYERGAEPNMKVGNFLTLCNIFDLDPRNYFELE